MKQVSFLATGALLGLAHAGVHKMKLQKIPLSEQLVRYPISALTQGDCFWADMFGSARNMPI